MTDDHLRLTLVRLISELYEKVIGLEVRIAALEAASKSLGVGYSRLLMSELLTAHFDIDELAGVAFNIGLDEVPGATREERARNLIGQCERRGMVGDMLQECQRLRPGVVWPKRPG